MSIIMEVVHTIGPATPKNFEDYVRIYGETAIPAMERSGFDIIGAFKWSTGEIGRDLLLIRFDSMSHCETASAQLGKEMMKGGMAPLMALGLDLHEHVMFANTLPYATDERLQSVIDSNGDKPRQYLYARLQSSLGKLQAAIEVVGELVGMLDGGPMKLGTGYSLNTGARGEFADVWALENGVGDLSYTTGAAANPLMDRLRDAVHAEALDYINPLPYSKMQ